MGANERREQHAAQFLFEAHAARETYQPIPEQFAPRTILEAYDIQDWKRLVSRMVVLKSDGNLVKIVAASDSTRSFANALYRWQQHPNQNSNDRDDHQQFDQREGTGFAFFDYQHETDHPQKEGASVRSDRPRL